MNCIKAVRCAFRIYPRLIAIRSTTVRFDNYLQAADRAGGLGQFAGLDRLAGDSEVVIKCLGVGVSSRQEDLPRTDGDKIQCGTLLILFGRPGTFAQSEAKIDISGRYSTIRKFPSLIGTFSKFRRQLRARRE